MSGPRTIEQLKDEMATLEREAQGVLTPAIEKQIERLRTSIGKAERVEKATRWLDGLADHSWLGWQRQFDVAGPTYTYGAVKVGTTYYVTDGDQTIGTVLAQTLASSKTFGVALLRPTDDRPFPSGLAADEMDRMGL